MPVGYGDSDDVYEVIQTNLDNSINRCKQALTGCGSDNCLECGAPIPLARKKVMPNATHCTSCKVKTEKGNSFELFNRKAHHDAIIR